jgi:uncharacterized protein YbbC (DUF1343 family)
LSGAFNISAQQAIVAGADRLDMLLPMLAGKQVGLVVNHTSISGGSHLCDTLNSLGICISRIFAPEHGFRGKADAGEEIRDGVDLRTGAPVISLYGKRKKPVPDDLDGLDAVVFDIQDVGARFYTYISTLFYVMEACAEHGKPLIVLDRPNPNGHYVDGPVLDTRFSSFVGIAPLPIVHGCTVGELALLFKGENWIHKGYKLDLQVITCLHYQHDAPYEMTVRPSPNLPGPRSILLYPSLCLFEGTTFSVGRGTDWPFEVIGHPLSVADTFSFIPAANEGNKSPLYEGRLCFGRDFRTISTDSLRRIGQINLEWLLDAYNRFPDKRSFFREDKFLDKLSGSDQLRLQIEDGCSEAEIRQSWQWNLRAFREIRLKYLLYD